MDERLRFVARLLEGEEMSALCREAWISRKTGYRIWGRYKDLGLEALTDRSRRPVRYGNQLPVQVESISFCKRDKPHWGARKIREMLVRRLPHGVRVPANSTIHGWTVTVSSNPKAGAGAEPTARRCRTGRSRTISGAPITRASSYWETGNTVIPLRSPITPRATCCCARRWERLAKLAFPRYSEKIAGRVSRHLHIKPR